MKPCGDVGGYQTMETCFSKTLEPTFKLHIITQKVTIENQFFGINYTNSPCCVLFLLHL
jgi:hypothetical protein